MSQDVSKVSEKVIKTAESKIQKILTKIQTHNLSNSYIAKLNVTVKEKKKQNVFSSTKISSAIAVFVLLLGVATKWVYSELSKKDCLLELPTPKTLFRPPEDCGACAGVARALRLENTSARDFQQLAYGATPVIVTDATAGWRAIKEFNFKFFADFYRSRKMGSLINDCYFFPYQSGFRSLDDVFAMDETRANLSGDPWYVGWSTCYSEETRALRAYYRRPYFLPDTAESDMVDWIFMGGPGQGAQMHVDSVRFMSWQAQVRGRKQWQLAPAPECLYQCRWITFTVEPGEVVVVDTNRWYHKTTVLPGDISITIGAEYD